MDIPTLLLHWLNWIRLFLYPSWVPKERGLSSSCLQDIVHVQCPEHNICLLNEYMSDWMQEEQYRQCSHHLLRICSFPDAKCFVHINYLIESSQQPLWGGNFKGDPASYPAGHSFLSPNERKLEIFTSLASLAARVAMWPYLANEI